MNPATISALCIASFMAGVAAMAAGSYLWLNQTWHKKAWRP